jgi:hypothetical protein
MFLGSVLGEFVNSPTDPALVEGVNEELQRKVQMLTRVCRALYEEIQWRLEEQEEALQAGSADIDRVVTSALQRAYSAFCVTAISRMMQLAPLRSSLGALALSLPSLPVGALAVLKLLVTTGSKGAAQEKGKERTSANEAHRNRGTRAEALTLLGQLVFSQDETAGKNALLFLLKLSVSEDFELRSKVINIFVRLVLLRCHSFTPLYLAVYIVVRIARLSMWRIGATR